MHHFADDRIVIKKISVGKMDNNVYVIVDPATSKSVVVDCADEAPRILAATAGTDVTAIWETHGDWDHLQALPEVKAALKVPLAIHPADAGQLPWPPDVLLEDGQTLTVGKLRFTVLHTPGHTAGGVCFYTPGHLIAGDTLFPGGPGNTRREGGDFPLIARMIAEKLFVLPDETRVYPGHGKDTTIGAEKPCLQDWLARGW